MNLYPLKFKPVYKDYPWGNTTLPATLDREAPEGIYAESWEVSTHPDGESVVVNGGFSGKTLSDVLKVAGADVLGSYVQGGDFPLLIKLIDAAKPLSVQVHPNNGNAEEVQGEPKTEMWYFLNEEPAQIYCGLTPGTTRDDFIEAIENESFEKILRACPAEKGGAAFVPGGRVHAIDAGCLILEIQQNSNTTYRVYDWGRVGNDGKPRELHVEKALQVIDFEDAAEPICVPTAVSSDVRNICTSEFFILDELQVDGELEQQADGTSFHALFSADAGFELAYGGGFAESVAKGESVLIPASLGAYTIKSDAAITVLKTTVPA
ncbi:type I phosphomannose isomerase catalytic subunit [Pontiella sp.]|uniref:type I phosphomannose isomerase catalytic subunit n=1 Tax=Pontiella sp. TaxID=2837462 RepID=UPI003567FC8D